MPSNSMHVNTIPFFWVAFYTDGTALPQFDFETGIQHFFKEIDQTKLEKFGWFPFSEVLAQKVNSKNNTKQYFSKPNLTHCLIKLKSSQRLIALRREQQSTYSYSHCFQCGFDWQWMPNRPDGSIGDSGLPRYGSEKYYYTLDHKVFEVICPKCGARNELDCPTCHKPWNKIDNKWTLQCPQCKKIRERYTQSCSAQLMSEIFLLGWQETLPDGTNKKMIMFIDEDGTVILNDDSDNV